LKLSSLYSNLENIFPRIIFHDGLNIIFAQVRDPENFKKDSHNLGKTFLIQVLEFCLLKNIDHNHPFKKRRDIFNQFDFYLEIETHKGDFVTVKRKVEKGLISINITKEKNKDLRLLSDEKWSYPSLRLSSKRPDQNAKGILNELLDLRAIAPYSYRKGVGYFLRSQNDYDDVFRISRFAAGKDRDWKPFLALLLGFDYTIIDRKYDLDTRKENLKLLLSEANKEALVEKNGYDELKAIIAVKRNEVERQRKLVNDFSFASVESEINENLVSHIETQISELNERKYIIDYELSEIERSLKTHLEFDLNKINNIYEEIQLTLPDNLIKSYEELIEFNKRLTNARSGRLRTIKEHRLSELEAIKDQLELLNANRQNALASLREKETLEKYRKLQSHLMEVEREIYDLEQRLVLLDRVSVYRKDIQSLDAKSDEIIEDIREAIHQQNERLNSIRFKFNAYVKEVFNRNAIFYVEQNKDGNLDFKVRTLTGDKLVEETFECEGTSYKKMMCACFDLALLSEYSNEPFYHFVYHDGIFESLDDRKKITLIKMVKRVCMEHKLQYILSIIDSDMPKDPVKHNLLFSENEIICFLSDEGDKGRLFKMPTF
jgi:uncharacterized protein YydD (DUF2326 family)